MEPAEILRLLRRHAPVLILHIVVGALTGFFIAMMSTPIYSSHASVVISTSSREGGGQDLGTASGPNSLLMPTLVELGTTQDVLNEVAASTGLEPAAVKGMLTLSARENTLFIDITAKAPSAEQAHAVADAEVSAFKKAVSKWGYKDGLSLAVVEQDPATLPTAPISPIPERYALNGALIGAAIGAAVVILLRRAGFTGLRAEAVGRVGRKTAGAPDFDAEASAEQGQDLAEDRDMSPGTSDDPSSDEGYPPPPDSSELFPPSMRHRR
ncbi:YveK family protein [Actinomyces sp. zg328]|uniref:YveK family protein n=1 Tax=Actinomyces sp. zg328 TaxID=2609287 RepID=UPI001359307E|nr:Wzz/FepE/Etk N-terminal domain-containing protein [Actinomyces sp. zg328]